VKPDAARRPSKNLSKDPGEEPLEDASEPPALPPGSDDAPGALDDLMRLQERGADELTRATHVFNTLQGVANMSREELIELWSAVREILEAPADNPMALGGVASEMNSLRSALDVIVPVLQARQPDSVLQSAIQSVVATEDVVSLEEALEEYDGVVKSVRAAVVKYGSAGGERILEAQDIALAQVDALQNAVRSKLDAMKRKQFGAVSAMNQQVSIHVGGAGSSTTSVEARHDVVLDFQKAVDDAQNLNLLNCVDPTVFEALRWVCKTLMGEVQAAESENGTPVDDTPVNEAPPPVPDEDPGGDEFSTADEEESADDGASDDGDAARVGPDPAESSEPLGATSRPCGATSDRPLIDIEALAPPAPPALPVVTPSENLRPPLKSVVEKMIGLVLYWERKEGGIFGDGIKRSLDYAVGSFGDLPEKLRKLEMCTDPSQQIGVAVGGALKIVKMSQITLELYVAMRAFENAQDSANHKALRTTAAQAESRISGLEPSDSERAAIDEVWPYKFFSRGGGGFGLAKKIGDNFEGNLLRLRYQITKIQCRAKDVLRQHRIAQHEPTVSSLLQRAKREVQVVFQERPKSREGISDTPVRLPLVAEAYAAFASWETAESHAVFSQEDVEESKEFKQAKAGMIGLFWLVDDEAMRVVVQKLPEGQAKSAFSDQNIREGSLATIRRATAVLDNVDAVAETLRTCREVSGALRCILEPATDSGIRRLLIQALAGEFQQMEAVRRALDHMARASEMARHLGEGVRTSIDSLKQEAAKAAEHKQQLADLAQDPNFGAASSLDELRERKDKIEEVWMSARRKTDELIQQLRLFEEVAVPILECVRKVDAGATKVEHLRREYGSKAEALDFGVRVDPAPLERVLTEYSLDRPSAKAEELRSAIEDEARSQLIAIPGLIDEQRASKSDAWGAAETQLTDILKTLPQAESQWQAGRPAVGVGMRVVQLRAVGRDFEDFAKNADRALRVFADEGLAYLLPEVVRKAHDVSTRLSEDGWRVGSFASSLADAIVDRITAFLRFHEKRYREALDVLTRLQKAAAGKVAPATDVFNKLQGVANMSREELMELWSEVEEILTAPDENPMADVRAEKGKLAPLDVLQAWAAEVDSIGKIEGEGISCFKDCATVFKSLQSLDSSMTRVVSASGPTRGSQLDGMEQYVMEMNSLRNALDVIVPVLQARLPHSVLQSAIEGVVATEDVAPLEKTLEEYDGVVKGVRDAVVRYGSKSGERILAAKGIALAQVDALQSAVRSQIDAMKRKEFGAVSAIRQACSHVGAGPDTTLVQIVVLDFQRAVADAQKLNLLNCVDPSVFEALGEVVETLIGDLDDLSAVQPAVKRVNAAWAALENADRCVAQARDCHRSRVSQRMQTFVERGKGVDDLRGAVEEAIKGMELFREGSPSRPKLRDGSPLRPALENFAALEERKAVAESEKRRAECSKAVASIAETFSKLERDTMGATFDKVKDGLALALQQLQQGSAVNFARGELKAAVAKTTNAVAELARLEKGPGSLLRDVHQNVQTKLHDTWFAGLRAEDMLGSDEKAALVDLVVDAQFAKAKSAALAATARGIGALGTDAEALRVFPEGEYGGIGALGSIEALASLDQSGRPNSAARDLLEAAVAKLERTLKSFEAVDARSAWAAAQEMSREKSKEVLKLGAEKPAVREFSLRQNQAFMGLPLRLTPTLLSERLMSPLSQLILDWTDPDKVCADVASLNDVRGLLADSVRARLEALQKVVEVRAWLDAGGPAKSMSTLERLRLATFSVLSRWCACCCSTGSPTTENPFENSAAGASASGTAVPAALTLLESTLPRAVDAASTAALDAAWKLITTPAVVDLAVPSVIDSQQLLLRRLEDLEREERKRLKELASAIVKASRDAVIGGWDEAVGHAIVGVSGACASFCAYVCCGREEKTSRHSGSDDSGGASGSDGGGGGESNPNGSGAGELGVDAPEVCGSTRLGALVEAVVSRPLLAIILLAVLFGLSFGTLRYGRGGLGGAEDAFAENGARPGSLRNSKWIKYYCLNYSRFVFELCSSFCQVIPPGTVVCEGGAVVLSSVRASVSDFS